MATSQPSSQKRAVHPAIDYYLDVGVPAMAAGVAAVAVSVASGAEASVASAACGQSLPGMVVAAVRGVTKSPGQGRPGLKLHHASRRGSRR